MWLTNNLLWTEGFSIIALLVGLGFLSFFFYRPALFPLAVLFCFCFFFFRNPVRVCPEAEQDARVLVCPSDGKVLYVEPCNEEDFVQKVAIFLSPLDVHVNWSPVSGQVETVAYRRGAFKMAFLDKSSDLNERNDVEFGNSDGTTIRVRQIAGTIARVIVCWVNEGDYVARGQKYGMIKFGSRIEVFVPRGVDIAVQKGQKVYGGQTVLGRIR